jgi:hypothetical protein
MEPQAAAREARPPARSGEVAAMTAHVLRGIALLVLLVLMGLVTLVGVLLREPPRGRTR